MSNINFNQKIILGSKSPRRQELLTRAGISFRTIEGDFEETFDKNIDAYIVPLYLSLQKSFHLKPQIKPDEILITADTVVIYNGNILGKPQNEQEAFGVLQSLSGQIHDVVTGFTLMGDNKIVNHSCLSRVEMINLSDSEIEFYLKKDKPFDKAGSYGIQDWIGLTKVKKIHGSHYNIMGLPVHEIYHYLKYW